MKKLDLSIYAITDRNYSKNLIKDVEDCLKAGVKTLQIREKHLGFDDFLEEAKKIKTICNKYDANLIINDNVKIAKLVDADGLHVGQDDMDIKEARKILGNKIIGVSASNYQQAKKAMDDGADYIGVGAIFPTGTKCDAHVVDKNQLEKIKTLDIKKVAIGGINKDNIKNLKKYNFDGYAIVSAIFDTRDVFKAVREIKKEIV